MDKSITWRKLDDLQLWEDNPNQGDVGAILQSVNRFGYNDTVAVWNDRVQGGNHRVMALHQLWQGGWQPGDKDRMVRLNGSGIEVATVDVSHLESEQEANAFGIALNRTTRLGHDDDAKLAALLQDIKAVDEKTFAATGFDGDDLDEILKELGQLGEPPEDPGAQINKADELREKWQTERGQLWVIESKTGEGEHRILCGDSTNADDVARLMGGVKADLMLTDPPYGIDVVKISKNNSGSAAIGSLRGRRKYPFGGVKAMITGSVGASNMVDATLYKPVYGDDKPFDPTPLLGIGRNQIIFGGNYFASKLPDSRCWIVWDKNNTGNFADAELAWTSFKTGVKLYKFTWNGLVREGKRDVEGVKRVHPTQKPVGLFQMILSDFSDKGDCVSDYYLGSGTTLVACEQTGRIGYGMEIDPGYTAVSLERLAGMGLEPRRHNGTA